MHYNEDIMEERQLKFLFQTLDDVKRQNGTEYWFARELFPCLGYATWESFQDVIEEAKTACVNAGGRSEDNFLLVEREENGVKIEDLKLTRYAAYLIAVNGDPRKQEIAFAQAYFVSQTRQMEVLQKRMHELERIDAREKLKITEKEFGDMVFSRGVDGSGIAKIRSRGDQELFGQDRYTNMKKFLNIPQDKPLADVLPTVTLKAKDLVAAMTIENARQKNLYGLTPLGREHVENNKSVRGALVKSGIYPENIPPAEDIKAIESRHRKEKSSLIKQMRELEKSHRQELDKTADMKSLEDTL